MITLLAETPRDQEMIEKFQRAYENLRKIVDKLEEENRKLREQLDEYKKRHPSNIGEKNGKPYEIKPEIMPQPAEKKKPGQKKGHRGFFRKSPDSIDRVVRVPVHRCPNCSSRLSSVQEIRERIIEDIPVPKTIVTKYRIERRYCKHCRIMVESQVDDALPNARLSIRTMLVVMYLKIGMRMSEENVSETMKDLFGITVSEGEVSNILKSLSDAFSNRYDELLKTIRESQYRHMDSTSWRNDGKNENLWTFVTRGEAIFKIDGSNGHYVPLSVLGEHKGTDIHDRHSAFETLAKETGNDQQYCWSHIISDAKELKKFYGSDGNRILRSLRRVYHEAKQFHGHGTMEDVDNLYSKLVFLLDSDYEHTKSRKFVDNLLKRKKEWLFGFVVHKDVEPTNNRAERALRPSVMYRKTNGGTRSETGDRTYEKLASISYTSRLRKSNTVKDGPPEIKKWMGKKYMKKIEERLDRSMKRRGQASEH
jgi:transposase